MIIWNVPFPVLFQQASTAKQAGDLPQQMRIFKTKMHCNAFSGRAPPEPAVGA